MVGDMTVTKKKYKKYYCMSPDPCTFKNHYLNNQCNADWKTRTLCRYWEKNWNKEQKPLCQCTNTIAKNA